MKAARLHGRKISVTIGHELSRTISAMGDGITVISSEPGAARKEKVLSTGVSHHVIDSLISYQEGVVKIIARPEVTDVP